MERWLPLDDAAAQDPAVAGAKAAGLALARAAGLPALPGAVLPVGASAPAVAAGAAAFERSGPAAAYLEATAAGDAVDGLVPPAELDGAPWVVRSSTPVDEDGRWSGAFASYLEVSGGDLAAAIRGCWASAVGRDATSRCAAAGVDPATLRIGVLVQPFVRFEAGGTARLEPDGTVVVSAAAGGPAGVVARGDGAEVLVQADGGIDGALPVGVSLEAVAAAASLARAAGARLGLGAIEWGAVGEQATLLQLGPAPSPAPAVTPRPAPARMLPEGLERIARLVAAFPGPLGAELVLPWAFGAASVPRAAGEIASSAEAALREARRLAHRLAAEVWAPSKAAEAEAGAAELAHLLRAGRTEEALAVVGSLAAPELSLGRRVLGLIGAIGDRLVADGRLPSGALVWQLTLDDLARAIDGRPAPVRRGPDRWEPFIAEVVRSRGRRVPGGAVQGGIGAGPARVLYSPAAALLPAPRSVVVARRPWPQLAPLLWQSAGLVTLGGTVGAHLFEVARSLGVPTVTGVDLGPLDRGTLLAVDGAEGAVSVLPGPAVAPEPLAELVGSR